MESNIKNILGIHGDLKDIRNPFELYRKMRPYYFSDSRVVREMTPELFEFTMSKLSTDMKQDMFEDMTRQMVCKLITPNLIPQTGPTGGGDGKTDIETYPVDEATSDKWYYADACKGNQKWAFAISCKSKWKPKIESDVEKIVNTKRGFNKIFFCTNQAVSSKNKADLSDKYKKAYNVEVIILDLNWYKQSVYENECYNIAVNSLNLSAQLNEVKEEGPNDKARRQELNKIEESIQSTIVHDKLNTSYVDDLLRTAILCRELEEPKTSISARFARALEQARLHGTEQQVFNIIYQKAWTAFYWYEDADAMFSEYLELKKMLSQEINTARIEKLYNLRNLITISVDCKLFKTEPDLATEDEYWSSLYDSLSKDPEHPSSFLYLKISTLESKLFSLLCTSEDVEETLLQLNDAIKNSVAHIDIPFDIHVPILNLAGSYIGNNPTYEEIVDTIAEINSKMKSEIASAEIHYDRGIQNLNQREFQLAIKHFGKCILAYQKEATKGNLVQASAMLAMSYQGLDLMYSAKILYVKALSLLFHKTETEGLMDHLIVTVLFNLCRLELKVGQLNSFFNWFFMLEMIVGAHPSFADDTYTNQRMELDSILSAILLNSSPDNEKWELLPSLCEAFGLSLSKDAALYTLGYHDELSIEFKEILLNDKDWLDKIVQTPKSDISLFPLSFSLKGKSETETLISGCRVRVTYRSDMRIQAYAELFLAFLETYMATMTHSDMVVVTPEIRLNINVKSSGKTEVKKGGRTNEYTIKINQKTVSNQEIWNTAAHLLANVLIQNSMIKDFDVLLKKKETEDFISDRLVVLENYYRELKLIFHPNYRSYLDLWWNKGMKKYPMKAQCCSPQYQARGKQSTQIITDLIDYPLWNKAKWSGCGYMMAYDDSEPAVLVLLYKDFKYAQKIFEKWEEDFDAKKLNLKITFITGVDAEHPYWYKVHIAPDWNKISEADKNKGSRCVVATSRFHLMKSMDDTNIRMFQSSYSKLQYVGITAAEISNNQISSDSSKQYPRVIPVTNINFREAWTIGENDPDSVAILPSDNPIIPAGKEGEALVLKLIESKKQRAGKI